jgi:hypothetical protein
MEGREKAHKDKYRENTNDSNYNNSSMLTSLWVLAQKISGK